MSKLRVYELARDLKVESKLLVTRMKSIGIEVQSHQSTLTDDQIDRIKKMVSGEISGDGASRSVPAAVAAGGGTRVIRRQRRPAEELPAEVVAAPAEPVLAEPTPVAPAAREVAPPAPIAEPAAIERPVVVAPSAPVAPPMAASAPSEAVQHAPVSVAPAPTTAPIAPTQTPISTAAASAAPQAPVGPGAGPNALPPRRPVVQGGATIVRRASPEELAAQRQRQEQRQQAFRSGPPSVGGGPGGAGPGGPPRGGTPFRREDARGTRVSEGFGGTGPGGGGFRGGPRGPETGGGGYGFRGPTIPTPDPDAPPIGWEDDDVRRREKERLKKFEAEETEEEKKNRIAKAKRTSGINTRILLSQIDETDGGAGDDDFPIDAPLSDEAVAAAAASAAAVAAFQAKTVYTPSAHHRKKDLKRRKDLKRTQITTPRAAYRVVSMAETITVGELAHQMSIKATDIIKKLMTQGLMATMNQSIDADTATLLAGEYGFEVESKVKTVADVLAGVVGNQAGGAALHRPPIVTVMGHVDHGKTSILDAIRQTKVAAGEAGGITQHIGAYTVERNGKPIAFLDTPGHEAFSSMRARGASLTDIVILVVAADDGVMPQTIEAINHAKAANVPIIVAINKIDKPNTNIDRVLRELSEQGIQSEEWGGEHQFVKVSALQKIGLDDLLEAVVLQADILELTAVVDCKADGAVIEAHLDTGRGPVATVMVKSGTLNVGDFIVAGAEMGKVRAMNDYLGRRVTSAKPSTPVEVLGLSGVPLAGDSVNAVADEKTAREVIGIRQDQKRKMQQATSSAATLAELLGKIKKADAIEVPLIVKADTQGSLEAISESVMKLNTERVSNRLVHKAVGGISESDLALAEATGAVIVGFNVRAARGLDEDAERRGIIIKYFSIIYDIVDVVKSLMAGQLPPVVKEVILGHAEVRQPITVPKIGTIAGSSVLDGKITRAAMLRLIRDNVVIYSGKVGSLRRFKDDVREVAQGYECGIGIDGYNDLKIGDVIEAFMHEEHAATL